MSLIIAENITHAYGAERILHNVSFRLAAGDRVGMVGPNGHGKTTLLLIIGGLLEPTRGQIHRRRGLRIGYLPQDPPAPGRTTVHDAMLDVFADLRSLEGRLVELAAGMGDGDEQAALYADAQHEFETRGGYDYPRLIEQVLDGLRFDRDLWNRPLGELSGGQRTRAYLAALLLKDPDVLMLDEPTNQLDLDCVEWLEQWLRSYRGALLAVSHDRYFLDSVTTTTWEVAFAAVEAYRGSYSAFVAKRDQRYTERLALWTSQQEHIARTEDFIARNIAAKRPKEARGRRTRLERFLRDEAIPKPEAIKEIHLAIPPGARTGDIVLRGAGLAVGYEASDPLVSIESLEVERGQRIAIVGPNGSGKTTLLRTLLGDLPALGGSVTRGANVRAGYVSQTHAEIDPAATAMAAVRAAAPGCPPERARSVLGSLLLGGDEALKRVGELSGGQRSRVVLARLAVIRPNLLVMDEPTSHLDIASTEIVQEVLQKFDGTVIFVSHDRYLVQAVATHIWAIEAGRLRVILGGWESYLQWRADARQGDAPAGKGRPDKAARSGNYRQARRRANLLQRLQRRHQQLESQIADDEAALAELSDAISAAGEAGDLEQIEKLGRRYQQAADHLKALWNEWEQVGEQLE